MTAQFRDSIKYNGQQYSLATEPLDPYLQAMDIDYPSTSTANYRGYIASWEIKDDKLYLIKLVIPGFNPEMTREEDLFPGEKRTFAEWYTGKLRIPHGELLDYVHQGYGSLFEKELYLRFLMGELIGKSEKDNRPEYEEQLAIRRRKTEKKESNSLKNRFLKIFR